MTWKPLFVGFSAFGLAGLAAYFVTDEAWFLVGPLVTMIGLPWLIWTFDRKIAELKRRSNRMICECEACSEDIETPPTDYVSVMDQAWEACWLDV